MRGSERELERELEREWKGIRERVRDWERELERMRERDVSSWGPNKTAQNMIIVFTWLTLSKKIAQIGT